MLDEVLGGVVVASEEVGRARERGLRACTKSSNAARSAGRSWAPPHTLYDAGDPGLGW